MVGQKFRYVQVDPDTQSRELREAVELLEQAGIIYRVKRTSGAGLPLEAEANDRWFKTLFLDIGLMQSIGGISEDILAAEDLLKINSGALAEQFVGQELLAYEDAFQEAKLYYWAREARNSQAEIDYLLPYQRSIAPIEVKAGKTGQLKSMHAYLNKYKASTGFKVSQAPFEQDAPVCSLPLYALASLFTKI